MLSWAGDEYLVTVDYHSGYFELDKLTDITSGAVIQKLKEHFSRHGCPELLVSDNASQYSSSLFKTFARDWGAVKVAKRILRKSNSSGEDPYIALLNLRNTPTEGLNTSPAQRLFGRRTKSMMPTAEEKMRPGYADTSQETALKDKWRTQSTPTNLRDLKRLDVGDIVRMQPIRTGERESGRKPQ